MGFLKCLKPTSLPVFARGLCEWWGLYEHGGACHQHTTAKQGTTHLSLYFLQRVSRSVRGQSKGLLRSFLGMSTASGSPGRCWSFPSISEVPLLRLTSWACWLVCCLPQLFSTTAGSHNVKDFLWLFSDKHLWIKGSTVRALIQGKWRQACKEDLPRKSPDRPTNDNSLRILLSRSSSHILAPSGCQAVTPMGCWPSRL